MDVGQPKVTTCVTECQTLVIQSEKMQHRCVQVMGVDTICSRSDAVFIGLSMNHSTLHATTGHP